jgi:hypothetical protein
MTLRLAASDKVPITGPRASGVAAPQLILGGFGRPGRGCEVSTMCRRVPAGSITLLSVMA